MFVEPSTLLFNVAAGTYAGSLFFHLFRRYRLSTRLLGIGFVLQTASLIANCWRWGFFSLDGVFNGTIFLPWCLAALALFVRYRGKEREASSLSWLVTIGMLFALLLPVQIPPPGPFTATWSSPMFFFFEVLAIAFFLAGGWFAWQYLRRGGETKLFDHMAIWGFILYSLAQVVGAVWSYLGWASPFHWGERHLQSAAIWCLYCGYLHIHFDRALKIRTKARWAFCGALVVLVVAYGLQVAAHLTILNPAEVSGKGTARATAQEQVHGAQPNACRHSKSTEDGHD